jgi:uncharacterized protein (TIGR04255 family)
MHPDTMPRPHTLANKPLVEAVFELRWKPDDDHSKNSIASHMLTGRYYDKSRSQYPVAEELPAAMLPIQMIPHVVRHRFRAAPSQWPLTQLGLGVLSVNDAVGYDWNSFRQMVSDAVNAVYSSFPVEIAAFTPTQLELRYINLLPFEFTEGGVLQFLKGKLHISIALDDNAFRSKHAVSSENDVTFSITVKLKEPLSTATMACACGENDGKRGIIWHISIRTEANHVPQSPEDVILWTTAAHSVVEDWFFTLSRGDLLKSFE